MRWKTSICAGVFAAHIAFFIAMSFAHTHKPAPKKHLVVTMRTAPPSIKTPKKTASAPAARKSSIPIANPPIAKKPAPAKKIENKPVAAAKKTPAPSVSKQSAAKQIPSKKKEVQKKAAEPVFDPVPENLIAELEESIAKIEQKQDKIYRQRKLDAPDLVSSLKSESSLAESQFFGEGEYKDALISYLHQSLNLPEWGEVKIKLTLKKDGSVAHVAVLKAESAKNRLHLEKNLPLLKFPPLDSSFANEEQHVFVLTFCNEI